MVEIPESSYIWRPEEHQWTGHCHLARFMQEQGITDYEELRLRSIEDGDWFWDAVIKDMGLSWFRPYERISDRSGGFPWTRWFSGGEINITYNCIDRHVEAGHGEEIALFYERESNRPNETAQITFSEFSRLVDRCCGALLAHGLEPGDAIGLYAPMRIETVVVMFAAFKIGARFAPVFCGFGKRALIERMRSCRARILFSIDTLHRRGKPIDSGLIVRAAAKEIPSIEKIIAFDSEEWPEFLAGHTSAIKCHHTAAEDPCLLLYTSGTTGNPKGTVHTHAGCLAITGKELRYAFDVRPGEPFFWLTDIGWMMGPWELIGPLLYRTPVVLFDGAPDYPTSDKLWILMESLGVVTFGVSPTAIRVLMRATNGKGPSAFDLSRLRLIGSTGELWDESSYQWLFREVGGSRCPIINMSGGTELMGCLLQSVPVQPLKSCTLGTGALGMDVDVFDKDGIPLREKTGYLVCKKPFPSMTKSFLNDDDRYLETYFSQFEGVWNHGDWASIDADGHFFLHGRSDDTFNVAGKRMGAAEIESALISHPKISEAAAIGVPDEIKGQSIVCFVVFKDGVSMPQAELIGHVAGEIGKPMAPRAVHSVAALPKTRSGKIVRGAIKKAYLGKERSDMTSIENPGALDSIASLNTNPGATSFPQSKETFQQNE